MSDTCLSFYLKAYRIHVHVDALRKIGSPRIICFLLGDDGNAIALAPYSKKDFHSHRVPGNVYAGDGGLELSSFPLCSLLVSKHKWNPNCSYRVPGELVDGSKIIMFDLTAAEIIETRKNESTD